MKQVNNYKYKALCIETNDFIVNVGRTNGKFKLLPVSAYKKELAKANNGLSMQLSFDFSVMFRMWLKLRNMLKLHMDIVMAK